MLGKNTTPFEDAASSHSEKSAIAELWLFLMQNKRWWMIPIVAALMLFGMLIFLSGTAVAPFIYTVF